MESWLKRHEAAVMVALWLLMYVPITIAGFVLPIVYFEPWLDAHPILSAALYFFIVLNAGGSCSLWVAIALIEGPNNASKYLFG